MDMKKYGLTPNMIPENTKGIPARVTAVTPNRSAKTPQKTIGGAASPLAGTCPVCIGSHRKK